MAKPTHPLWVRISLFPPLPIPSLEREEGWEVELLGRFYFIPEELREVAGRRKLKEGYRKKRWSEGKV